MQRRQLIATASAFAAIAAAPGLSWAQNNTIRLIVPFPAGGATDIVARTVGDQLSRELGQPVIVDNKGGAGGSIGMAELARAAPDGLTIGVATLSTHGVNPAVYKRLPYDAEKSFTPIAELVKAPGVLMVSNKLGVKDFASFVKLVQANPGKFTYASPGNGTIGHMWGEILKASTNTFILHIPFRGAAPATTALLGGQVDAYFDQVASALPHIKAGRAVAVAVSWPKRLDVLPQVPTFGELGQESNNFPSWFGLVGPAGMPAEVTRRLHEGVVKALNAPGMKEKLAALGLYPSDLTTPQQFGEQIRKEIERMRVTAQFSKIQLD